MNSANSPTTISQPNPSFLLRATKLSADWNHHSNSNSNSSHPPPSSSAAVASASAAQPSPPPTLSSSHPQQQTNASAMELFDFLSSAELEHYFTSFHEQLRVRTVSQLKYVQESDLQQLGLTAPEQRRLWKYFEKHCPQTTAGKLMKRLSRSASTRNTNNHLHRPHSLNGDRLPPPPTLSSQPFHILSEDGGDLNSTSFSGQHEDFNSETTMNCQQHATHHLILPEHLELGAQLGEGEFGKVHQGVWHSDNGPIQVAIKVLCTDLFDTGQLADFLKEVAVMHSVAHSNVVRLYGVVMDRSSLQMVTELAPLRSLLECLREESLRPSLHVPTLHSFALQIAEGMAYLERKRLIHRDLAARNILVFSRDRVKISDFGMSKALQLGKEYYQSNLNVNLKLPMAWCAPESINYLRFTSASDVWAYGVTLWEMFSYGFQPWAGLTGDQILDQIDEPICARLPKPDFCPSEYYELLQSCWQHEARKRCSFQQIVGQLPRMAPEKFRLIRDYQDGSSSGMSGTLASSSYRSGSKDTLDNNTTTSSSTTTTTLFLKGDVVVVLDKNSPDLWKVCHLSNFRLSLLPPDLLAPLLGVGSSLQHSTMGDNASFCDTASLSNTTSSTLSSASGIYQFIAGRLKRNKRSEGKSGTYSLGSISSRSSSLATNSPNSRGITREMISLPQNDFRHVMHVGSDGNTFGDLGFLRQVSMEVTSSSTTTSSSNKESSPIVNPRNSSHNNTRDSASIRSSTSSQRNSSNVSKYPIGVLHPHHPHHHHPDSSSLSDTLTSVSDLENGNAGTLGSGGRRKTKASTLMPTSGGGGGGGIVNGGGGGTSVAQRKTRTKMKIANKNGHHRKIAGDEDAGGRSDVENVQEPRDVEDENRSSSSSEAYESLEAGGDWDYSPAHLKNASSPQSKSPPTLPPARPQSYGLSSVSAAISANDSIEDSTDAPNCMSSILDAGEGSLFDDILKCLDSFGTSLSTIEEKGTSTEVSRVATPTKLNSSDEDKISSSNNPLSLTSTTSLSSSTAKALYNKPQAVVYPVTPSSPRQLSYTSESQQQQQCGQQSPKKEKHRRGISPVDFSDKISNKSSGLSSSRLGRKFFATFGVGGAGTGGGGGIGHNEPTSAPPPSTTSSSTIAIYSKPIRAAKKHLLQRNSHSSVTNSAIPEISSPRISGPVLISTTNKNWSSIDTSVPGAIDIKDTLDTDSCSSGGGRYGVRSSQHSPQATGGNTGSAVGIGGIRAIHRTDVFLASSTGSSNGTLQRRRASMASLDSTQGGITTTATSTTTTTQSVTAVPAVSGNHTLQRTRQPSLPLTSQVTRTITEMVASSGGQPVCGTLSRRLSFPENEESSSESSHPPSSTETSPHKRGLLTTINQHETTKMELNLNKIDKVAPSNTPAPAAAGGGGGGGGGVVIPSDNFWGEEFAALWLSSTLMETTPSTQITSSQPVDTNSKSTTATPSRMFDNLDDDVLIL